MRTWASQTGTIAGGETIVALNGVLFAVSPRRGN
jgi:hypothetical protein